MFVLDRRFGGHLAAAGIFVVCAILLSLPWTLGDLTIPWDAKAHFQPQFAFLAHRLHRGESPFWTSNVFAGSPQIADPQSLIFSPFFLIAAWLVPDPSFVLEDGLIFAMLAMGGVALIAYFRDRGWSAAGGLIAALAFAFGGSAAWRIQHTGQVMSLAWFPLVLFLLARALDRRSLAYGAAAGFFAACLVLGRDQVAFLEVVLLSAYAIDRLLRDDRPMGRGIATLCVGALVGAAAIALPIAWTLDFAWSSNRPAIDLDGAFKGSLPPGSFLTLICANLFGTDGPLADFWGPPSSAFGTRDIYLARNMTALYLGLLPLAALVGAASRRFFRERDIVFFCVALVLLALYALGRYTPAFEMMFALPGVDLWRRPADASFVFCAVIAILGGYGFHLVESGEARPRPAALWLAFAACFALAIGVAADKGRLIQAAPAIATSAALAVASGAILLIAPRLREFPAVLLALVAGALTLDLAIGNEPNESTALPRAQFDVLRTDTQNETIALLKRKLAETAAPDRRDRVELAGIGFHWPNASLVHDLDHDLGYNPLRLKLFEDATGAIDHVALPEQREFSKLAPSYRSTLTDLLGLRFIATGAPVETIDNRLQPGDLTFIARTADAYVYENPRAAPRVLAPVCAQRADFARMLETGEWPPVDFRETVLLEGPTMCRKGAGDFARASIVSYQNAEVVIEAEAPASGAYVVLNDVWHPYWRAYVDGVETPVLRANVLFRAVAAPAGHHRIRFVFEPLRGLLSRGS